MPTPRIIAEIGSNHNQDPERMVAIIKAAKEIGCDAVKLQMFDERLQREPEAKEIMARTKLSKDMVSRAFHACRDAGIPLHCTPFHPEFVEFLDPYVEEFKIGSYEILWLDLIRACAQTRKPIGISTGGASIEEIAEAYRAARCSLPPEFVTLYQCDPHYPAHPKNASLARMVTLKDITRWIENSENQAISPIGYSDHTTSIPVMMAAVARGAKELEFHIDLNDMRGAESHHGHVWPVSRAKEMIDMIREVDGVIFGNRPVSLDLAQRMARTDPTDGARPILTKEETTPNE